MARKEDVEVLRRRAVEFLEVARDDIRAGRYDLAAFHCEQATQLALKHFLARELGYFPRTHDLRELIELAGKIKPSLRDLYEEFKFEIEVMLDAYVGAKYLPRSYRRDVVEKLYSVAERVVREVGVN
ncbi:MAG: HEPN domain-containing protein [Candidatus Verstraetearchaeota archaeon]|nr:HEPN domain-containing protein [Candidatus Verstraetearchaeota archaeon]